MSAALDVEVLDNLYCNNLNKIVLFCMNDKKLFTYTVFSLNEQYSSMFKLKVPSIPSSITLMPISFPGANGHYQTEGRESDTE